jgi:hypothetical protein
MLDPVIVEVPVSYVNNNVVMESFANALDVSRAEIQEALQVMVRDVKVSSDDGINVMVLAMPKEPMDFYTEKGRDIIVVYAEDPVTN